MLNGASHGSTYGMDSPLGLEWPGAIAALGEGVTAWKLGDRISGSGGGAFADYTRGYATLMLPVPAALSCAEAATMPLALLTSHDGLATNGTLQPGQSVLIAASKHGVIGLTKTIAIKLGMLGKDGVTANALCPGPIDTPIMEVITDHLAPGMSLDCEKFHKVAVAKNIRRRLLDARGVASIAAHLASDKARGSTGHVINVCGGMVLC